VDIYHPSRQNTQTGLLTMPMFVEVLKKAKAVAEGD
jgi:uracil-DNA glycosylase